MPAQGPPLVTAIVICFNQARFVRDALDSVWSQTYQRLELIIVDDCSTDASLQVIEEWCAQHRLGRRVMVLAQKRNQGICASLNAALRQAKGDYVGIVAADDTWMPDKIARQIEAFDSAADDVAVVYTDAHQCDENGRRIERMFIASHRAFDHPPAGDILEILIQGNFIPVFTALIRRSVLATTGNFDERLAYEDWDLWLRIAAQFKFLFLNWPSGTYRLVPTSLSQQLFRSSGIGKQRRLASDFLIYEKCLSIDRLQSSTRTAVQDIVVTLAEQIYATATPRAWWYALRAAMVTRRRKALLLTAFCVLRLPHNWFRHIDEVHSRRHGRAS